MPIVKRVTVENSVCTFHGEDGTSVEVEPNLAMGGITDRFVMSDETLKFHDAKNEAEKKAATRYMVEASARKDPPNIHVMLLRAPYRVNEEVNGEVKGIAQDYRLWEF